MAAYLAKFHRLAALLALRGAGLVTCITFVWLSAPDLALTQLVVEAVTTVLLLLGLRWLPKRSPIASGGRITAALRPHRILDLAIAVAAGAGLSALVYAVMTRPALDSISRFFVENAYTAGGGTNIVNVILVDFRGFDTLGEIAVLGVVAVAVYALLRRFRPAPESMEIPEQQREGGHDAENHQADWLAIPGLIMGILFPVVGLLAVFLFLRGHDLPGGGFVAGLVMATAFILQYMASGSRKTEARLRILPVRWMGFGLLCSAGTGAAAWVFGWPFLTSTSGYIDLPLVGKTPLASALLFDLGIFLLVVGATVLMLIAIARQSVRSHRAARAPAPAEVAVVAAAD